VQAEAYNLFAGDRLRVSDTFAKSNFATSDLLRRSALADFKRAAGVAAAQKHAAVLDVARRFGDPALGSGFDAMKQVDDEQTRTRLITPAVVAKIADSGVAPELDRAARALPPEKLKAFAVKVASAAAGGDTAALRAMVARPADLT
jgi:hypothetical protein